MSEYTPGPWAFRARGPRDVTLKRDHWDVGQPSGKGVAIVFGDDEANVNLIAAAPDLLAAAKDVLNGLNARIESSLLNAVPVFDGIAALDAAIAKAEGRAP